ncbi:hypothetical protein [Enterococcus durans]|uniref:hypothetical protein n=1 Tax=Enterococcus durans TaxID=53345 RepID=UPI00115C95EE|nr:hypothetical protein [Enterococcus durans]
MSLEFSLESRLVDSFIETYQSFEGQIVVKELNIRHGNIDVVGIQNVNLPFTANQIKVLSKPSSAMVFSYLKNRQLLTKVNIQRNIGLSNTSLEGTLAELIKAELIEKIDSKYLRKEKFEFPKTVITGYEAKLMNFNKAFYQAKNNRHFVDYSYLVFPESIADRIYETNRDLLIRNGIGLIGVGKSNSRRLIKANKNNSMKNYIRLLNLTKSLTYIDDLTGKPSIQVGV